MNTAQVRAQMEQLARDHSDRASFFDYGPFVGLTFGNPEERAVILEFNTHGRERATSQLGLHLAKTLTQNPPPEVLAALKNTFVMVIPIHNPTGYDQALKEPLWRKTYDPANPSQCPLTLTDWLGPSAGTDPNRNYPTPAAFPPLTDVGSTDPCVSEYRGPASLSEPITKAMYHLAQEHSQNAGIYLTVHGTQHYVAYPPNSPSGAEEMVKEIAKRLPGITSGRMSRAIGGTSFAAMAGLGYKAAILELPEIGKTGSAPSLDQVKELYEHGGAKEALMVPILLAAK